MTGDLFLPNFIYLLKAWTLTFFQDFFQFVHNLMQLLKYIERIYYHFFLWDLLLLFVFYLISRICIWLTIFNAQSEIKSLPFIDVSNPIWYLTTRKKWLKQFFYNVIYLIIIHQFYVIINYNIKLSIARFAPEHILLKTYVISMLNLLWHLWHSCYIFPVLLHIDVSGYISVLCKLCMVYNCNFMWCFSY